ncbi:MAG: Isonitrile hydratase [Deltaproteobacteria bacterium ADurb.BinA179]|nr:DJ-1/PfpI family protein [Deltaproteobacteria bacterium]MDI9541257.1 DJ-1/PfpI family protein [Pseudomonadota bacterium]NLW69336.1 DJ-1/PfpI family protein [Bacteriovoracaceae bacterium]OPZ28730.1 MAG: Isonitrile hydratase [Deltaproteobacteria bacterium ADurb.BinA179]HRR21489.1 DJ-1/PfpI family protein [Desulfomonilia bacterium]
MKHVLILLANGFEVYEAAAFTDVLGWADTFGTERIRVVTAGIHPELTCTFGYQTIPATLVNELDLDGFDALAIPGGFGTAGFYEDSFSEEFLEVMRAFARHNKPIAAVCVASLCLGKSGILKGKSATTYHLEGRKRQQLAGMGAIVRDSRIVRDGNLITSTSPGTAVDVAFLLLEILSSRENADHIRKLMGFR